MGMGAVAETVLPLIGAANRRELETIITAAIERLDEIDGDADLEANGDEADGSGLEDEFGVIPEMYGAGCPVADPGELEDQDSEGEWLIDQRTILGRNAMPVFRDE